MNKKGIAVVVMVGVVGFIGKAIADGIPTMQPLTYSGVLQTSAGAAVTTQQSIQITLWDDAAANASANQKCTTPTQNVTPDAQGRFQVLLDQACFDAVKVNANLWVQVQVGATVLPRSKLGAVPYAAEAGKATRHVLAANNKRVSANGLFCGTTGNTNGNVVASGGALTGYLAAKFLCEQVNGCSSSAHMCTGDEAINSHLLGIAMPIGWVRSGAYLSPTDSVPPTQGTRTTCGGYKIGQATLNGSTHFGAVWDPVPLDVSSFHCGGTMPVLCCD